MNLFQTPGAVLPEELVSVLAQSEAVRIERIVSTGQTSNWYDQAEAEFVALLAGSATLEFEDGKTLALSPGDNLVIPPHQRHRVAHTSTTPPAIWLCVFF